MHELELIRSFGRQDVGPNPEARAAAHDRLLAHIAHDGTVPNTVPSHDSGRGSQREPIGASPLRVMSTDEQARLHGGGDAAVVAHALAGDMDAWTLLYRRCMPIVWKLSYFMLRDRDEAEDATQETFLKVRRSLGRYRGSGTLRAWVLAICRNVCLDRCRSGRTVVSIEGLLTFPWVV